MARVDATAAKAAAALAAAQLTVILQDDTLTELAVENKSNHSPLRGIEKMFLLDAATGAVTANDAYIDAAYAGNFPTSGIDSGRQSQGVPTPITVVSAAVAALAPKDIVLTFSEPIYKNPATAITLGGNSDPAKVIESVTYAGAVVTITVNTDYVALATISVSGRFFGNRGYIDLADEAVTNNVS